MYFFIIIKHNSERIKKKKLSKTWKTSTLGTFNSYAKKKKVFIDTDSDYVIKNVINSTIGLLHIKEKKNL